MKRFALALLLIAAGFAQAQETQLHITGGDAITVKVDKVVIVKEDRLVVRALPFKLNASAGAADYRWSIPPGVTATEVDDILTVTAAPKGELTFSCRVLVVDFEKKVTKRSTQSLTVNIGDVVPPLPPTPPDPPKPPIPPPPAPPIPQAGFRVLIVYETADLTKLPSAQASIITAKSIRDYLNLRCVAGTDGAKEWRIWDQNVSTANVPKIWQDAMSRPRTALPWIVISNGVAGFEGPLPANVTDTLDLLRRYGGV